MRQKLKPQGSIGKICSSVSVARVKNKLLADCKADASQSSKYFQSSVSELPHIKHF